MSKGLLKQFWEKNKVEIIVGGSIALLFGTGYFLGVTDWHHDMDSLVKASEDAAKETCGKIWEEAYDAGNLNAWKIAAYYDRDLVTDIFTKLNRDDLLKRILEATDAEIAKGGVPT